VSVATYDFAIVGAGSAGLIAADFARKLGVRVALLERERIGGDCTWTGCVPSKSLLRVARLAHDMRTASRFGIGAHVPDIDMVRVREYLRSTIAQIYEGTTPAALGRKNIDVLLGPVSFVDAHRLDVGDRHIRAKKILVATGAAPAIPAIPGLTDVPFFTYRQIFEHDRLPERLVVIGGGPVGVEVAQAYQRLGSRVTIFAERLLAKEERRHRRSFRASFNARVSNSSESAFFPSSARASELWRVRSSRPSSAICSSSRRDDGRCSTA